MSRVITISPLSNDPLRDWPMDHHLGLARLCVEKLDAVVNFIGIRSQRAAVSRAVRDLPADRYRNLCGSMSWPETGELLRRSDCVIANNSGIAHYAATLGVATICIFGGSHAPYEWMARGPAVSVLYKKTGCSPCACGLLSACPYNHRCLTEILPAHAFSVVTRAMERGAR